MSNLSYTHLTEDNRQEIMECLDKGIPFKNIAKRVGKSPTTISREIKKRLVTQPVPAKLAKADGTPIESRPCPLLLKAPFVCNSCDKRRRICPYQKQLYLAKDAHKHYETLLVEAREGTSLNKEAFWAADAIIHEGIKKGQRLYHISQTHDLGFSISTVYRHVHKGNLSISKTDLPRVVKFKARKQTPPDTVTKAMREGRSYADFLSFTEAQEINHWVELDTVVGRIGGKTIMTFHFTLCNFMFGLLLDNKTAAEASAKVKRLKQRLIDNGESFGALIPLMLTDNGGEFANVQAFTHDLEGQKEADLYFCDPYRSSQKPNIEKNHTLFRDIVPKGTSFDTFTQEQVNLVFSHVNGVKRKVLGGKSPYDLFTFLMAEHLPALLGIQHILAEQVIQSPKLLQN